MSGTKPQEQSAPNTEVNAENTGVEDNVSTAVEGEQQQQAAEQTQEDNKSIDELSTKELENMSMEELEGLLTQSQETTDENTPPADANTPPADTVEGGEDPENPPASQDDPQDNGQNQNGIPPQRLAKEADKRRTAEERLEALEEENRKLREAQAYNQGKEDATKPAPVDPLKVIEENIQNLDTAYDQEADKIAKSYEKGDLTYSQMKAAERQLDKNYNNTRDGFEQEYAQLQQKQSAPTPEQINHQLQTDTGLQQHTIALAEANPWLANLNEAQSVNLNTLAENNLASQGITRQNTDPVNFVAQVRSVMCQIGVDMGFDKLLAPANADVPAKDDPGTKPTPEQRKDKLDLATKHPPHPTKGGVDAPTDVSNTIDWENITDAELANSLPQSTLEKMAGL